MLCIHIYIHTTCMVTCRTHYGVPGTVCVVRNGRSNALLEAELQCESCTELTEVSTCTYMYMYMQNVRVRCMVILHTIHTL